MPTPNSITSRQRASASSLSMVLQAVPTWPTLVSPTNWSRARPSRFSTTVTANAILLMSKTLWRESSALCSTPPRSRTARTDFPFRPTRCITSATTPPRISSTSSRFSRKNWCAQACYPKTTTLRPIRNSFRCSLVTSPSPTPTQYLWSKTLASSRIQV